MAAAEGRKGGPKNRTLHLITSLDPDNDDERTSVSKKISWILRRGAKVAGVKMSDDGWVNIDDLMKAEILEGIALEALMQVIVDSNGKKLRYELRETKDETFVKAYSKQERKAKEGAVGGGKVERGGGSKNLSHEATPFAPQAPSSPTSAAAAAPAASYPYGGVHPYAGYAYGYGGYPGYGAYGAYNAYAHQWQQYAAAQHMAAQHAVAATSGWSQGSQGQQAAGAFNGRIKSYNPDKGFGFIDCYQTYELYRRDVFLHKSNIGDFGVGDVVSFACEVNSQGMPQAVNVTRGGQQGGRWVQKGGKGGDEAGEKGKGKGGKEGKGKKGEGKKGKKGLETGEDSGKEGSRWKKTGKKAAKTADGDEEGAKEDGKTNEEAPQAEDAKQEEPKKEDAKKEDDKKADKKEESKKEEPKKEETKKEEAEKKEAPAKK